MCSLGIEPTTFWAADAMLYHWATQEQRFEYFSSLAIYSNYCVKGIVHPTIKILSLITHPHVVLLTQTCKTIHFHSFMKHKLRYFWWNLRAFWPCIDRNATETFKVQKGSKYIVNIVHVTSMVQFYEGMRIPFFVYKSKQK